MATFVEIKNYKTIRSMSFEFEGYATVLGKNFIGKSAVVEAIDAALNNKTGTDFITWGEKYCEVHIRREGLDLLWHKEKGNNFYLINGETYEKISSELPQPIIDAGFGDITVSGEKINLNYAKQFQPLFLVHEKKKGYVTDLLAAIYGIDTVYKADGLCKKDLKKTSSLLKLRAGDKILAEEELARLGAFPSIEKKTKELSTKKSELIGKRDLIRDLERFREEVVRCSKNILALRPVTGIVDPEPVGVEGLISDIKSLEIWAKSLKETKTQIISLRDVSDVTDADQSEGSVRSLLSEVDKMDGFYKILSKATSEETNAKSVLDIKDISSTESIEALHSDLQKMESLMIDLDMAQDALQELEPLEAIPSVSGIESLDFGEVEKLERLYAEFLDAARSTKKLKGDILSLEGEMSSIQEELDGFDKCPTCGGDFHGNH